MALPTNLFKVVVGMLLVVSATACVPTSTNTNNDLPFSATKTSSNSDGLVVKPESNGKYDRTAWGDWTTHVGCSTREQILKDSGDSVKTGAGCKILSGHWVSPYDLKDITNPVTVQIDHIVPLKEAFQSGADAWNAEQRNKFYNDRENLVAVSAHSNTSKSDQDLAEWLPVQSYVCSYTLAYEHIKKKYSLSVDSKENTKLQELKTQCKG